jgi:hypothetical protein
MKWVGVGRMMLGAVLVISLTLLAPCAAGAADGSADAALPAPGLDIRGIGIAPARDEAIGRAVRDARHRAAMVAHTLSLVVGEVETVELPVVAQFGTVPPPCGRTAKRPPKCSDAAAAAQVRFGLGASAETNREVIVHGLASVEVEPRDDKSNRSIRTAVLAARTAATREAAADALRSGRATAASAGLQLGTAVSVVESESDPEFLPAFFSGLHDYALGFWAPGQFCKSVWRRTVHRDPRTGQLRIGSLVHRHRCSFPSHYTVELEVRFAAGAGGQS